MFFLCNCEIYKSTHNLIISFGSPRCKLHTASMFFAFSLCVLFVEFFFCLSLFILTMGSIGTRLRSSCLSLF